MNSDFVAACSVAPSVAEIRPTPFLKAFRSPLLARCQPRPGSKSSEAILEEGVGEESVELGRGSGLEVAIEEMTFEQVCSSSLVLIMADILGSGRT